MIQVFSHRPARKCGGTSRVRAGAMGSQLSRRVSAWRARKLRRVLLVGLDNSGKTTVVRQLTGGDTQGTIPTTEADYLQVKYKGLELMLMVSRGDASVVSPCTEDRLSLAGMRCFLALQHLAAIRRNKLS